VVRGHPRGRVSNEPRLPGAVLFDMDDTIFDHSLTCRAALAQLRRETGMLRRPPLEDLWREYTRLLGATHTDVMLGRRSAEEVRSERFLALAAWSGDPVGRSTAAELSRGYRRHYQRLRRPVRGAPEFVRRLRGRARIGIVTNNTVAEQREKLHFLGLDTTVDFLVTSEEVGAAKPDPAIFRAALTRAGVPGSDAVMVGDWWDSDVIGALEAGIRPLWFNRFHAPRPSDRLVAEFASFLAPRRLEHLLAAPAVPETAD
jgi:HAD superfamily hydrolase (TIGR01509 family)